MPDSSPPIDRTQRVQLEPAELRKPHEMIVMVPQSHRVTLTGRKIYNVLLGVAQLRMEAMGTLPLADFLFDAPLHVVLKQTGSSGDDRTAAKRYLTEMQDLKVTWESTAPGDGVKWRGFHMLTEVVLELRKGETWISWSLPPTIVSALRDPTRWARLNLDILAKLSTYAAMALYEICARYRDNPSGVTSRKPVTWWIDGLSTTPPGTGRREWRKFKNERLNPAIEEINRETDLEIELIEHKQGRTIVDVQFAIRKKMAPASVGVPTVDSTLVLRAESLGIKELKLEGLLREFGDERVRAQLVNVERRAANSKLREIENPYSYLRTLLRNGEEAPLAEEVPQVVVESRVSPSAGYVNPDSSRIETRMKEIKREIGSLPTEERARWANLALADLSSKHQLSAVVARRAEQGDVLHGLLGATVVRLYAESRHGASWLSTSGMQS